MVHGLILINVILLSFLFITDSYNNYCVAHAIIAVSSYPNDPKAIVAEPCIVNWPRFFKTKRHLVKISLTYNGPVTRGNLHLLQPTNVICNVFYFSITYFQLIL